VSYPTSTFELRRWVACALVGGWCASLLRSQSPSLSSTPPSPSHLPPSTSPSSLHARDIVRTARHPQLFRARCRKLTMVRAPRVSPPGESGEGRDGAGNTSGAATDTSDY
jgi:hypothetical protein